MSSNFPVDDDGNWLSLPEEPGEQATAASERRIWPKSNRIINSFITQVAEIAPLKSSAR